MARIRSVHPGLFTDEAFATLTPIARVMLIGIWTECDDGGSFEWSPLKLKMRLLPADNADAAALLDEMVHAGIVKRYDIEGRSYGAIRNFCRFQRPQKPNSTYPQTPEVQEWVGLGDREKRNGSRPLSDQYDTDTRKARQMEDEGGRREDGDSGETSSPEPRKRGRSYAFSGRTIKLTSDDLEKWRATYHGVLDVEAELTSLDAWLETATAEKRKRWFHTASGALNRKHQEALAAKQAARDSGEPSRQHPAIPYGMPC